MSPRMWCPEVIAEVCAADKQAVWGLRGYTGLAASPRALESEEAQHAGPSPEQATPLQHLIPIPLLYIWL